jgi:hypothetical protein
MRIGRLLLAVAAAISIAGGASAGPGESWDVPLPAAKQDSGLGELPPFAEWSEPWMFITPAEKVDSGLGALAPYPQWTDPWVFAMPAEKIDSGLGDIVPVPAVQDPARLVRGRE